ASRYTVVLRQSESAACGGRTEASHRIHASFIERTPCCVAPAGITGTRVGPVLPTDMAYWGGQRLYGAFARAPKTAERRSGPVPPEWGRREKCAHLNGRFPNGS